MQLVSFDIFDTVLIRRCGRPENIFWLVARKGFSDEEPRKKFYAWRCAAESLARREIKKTNLTFDDIYRNCPFPNKEKMAEIEKETESENLMAVPEIREKIQAYREQGNAICFISDMYLPSSFLAGILKREQCLSEEEQVWVSCEHQARKSNGSLYEIVRNRYQPERWIHYGDNPQSDIRMAKKAGIEAVKVEHPYTPIEKKLQGFPQPLPTLAGLSRTTALLFHDTAAARFAADFVAPVYLSYCQWVLHDAAQKGIKKLYFLSRDSYIFYQIAKIIHIPGISLHYLFLSRKALERPYAAVIHNRSDEELPLFKDYLLQEGVSTTHIAMVDIGWWGTTRKMLNEILDYYSMPRVSFYYLNVRKDVKPAEYGEYQVYFPQGEISTRLTSVLEDYFSASPYPTTTGYQRNPTTQRIEPLFGDGEVDISLVRLHESVAKAMYPYLRKLQLSDADLKRWNLVLLHTLDQFDVPIHVTALEGHGVKILSLWDLFKYAVGGYFYERCNVMLTCRYPIGKILIYCNGITEGVKRFLYQNLIKPLTKR